MTKELQELQQKISNNIDKRVGNPLNGLTTILYSLANTQIDAKETSGVFMALAMMSNSIYNEIEWACDE